MANEGHWGSQSGSSAWTLKCEVWELSHTTTLLIATFPVSDINKHPYLLKISTKIKVGRERWKELSAIPQLHNGLNLLKRFPDLRLIVILLQLSVIALLEITFFYSGQQTQYYMRFPFHFLNMHKAYSAANMYLIRTKQAFHLLFTTLTWTWPSGLIN